MGLIAAALNAAGGTLASQWKEFFFPYASEPAWFSQAFLLRFPSVCRRERAGLELPPHKSNAARREKTACPFVIETATGCTERCG